MRHSNFLALRAFLSVSAVVRVVLVLVLISPAVILASDDQTGAAAVRDLIRQSIRQARRGNLSEAEKLLERAIGLAPKDSNPRLRMAMLRIKQRRLADAYNTSFAIAAAEPQNPYALAVLGTALLTAGRFREARPVLYTALNINKREASAWAALGMLEFYENNIERSVSDLREAIYLDPGEPDYYFTFGQISARAERYRDAADAYAYFLNLSRGTDDERRARIRGLINFLRYLGQRPSLYTPAGASGTKVRFEIVGNRPVIKVKINGRSDEQNFVLDTGSGISVISDVTAKRLNVRPITRGGFARGLGGTGKFEIVYGFVREMDIGGVKVRNVPVYIRQFRSEGQPVDGYIGLSLISKFLATIDYGNRSFELARKDRGAPSRPVAELSLPLRLTSSGFLSGEVEVEGVSTPLNFIVDTGASVSVISRELADLEALTPFVTGEKMRVIGSAGITDDVPLYRLPKVSFGGNARRGLTAIALDLGIINEASGFVQAGILGGNFLMNYKITFDFDNSRVTFVLNDRPN